ncbi:autotransporter assembly complex protein TamA [Aestuariicoccus sp. MJ-SS9]|uniref:autotransporter assembly complex protein TamA n=1 Tax=Aestuariicoccus sp. MJ-SS9 TaxID=3079855 RepID=UPI00290F2D61|nr:BamA/TamA family outer membrane protein [Aestuariicoccus sp. MJ-SS9]MDU8910401.1 BamA/TamA family outer membrane protein [Aestuariicoccus sp. MJ-SS9]
MTVYRSMCAVFCMGLLAAAPQARALDDLQFRVDTADEDFTARLKDASLLRAAKSEGRVLPEDLMATALADYRRLTEYLYSEGYYGGTVNIRVDGTEAAAIPVLSPPSRIGIIVVEIDPGPLYRFSRAQVAPLAEGTEMPEGFREGEPAPATLVGDAVDAAVTGWREAGHAKAEPVSEKVTANHSSDTLSADVRIGPGPRLRFGRLEVTTPSAVRAAAIRRIAGLPRGEVFHPDEVARSAERLRRTEAFSSVQLVEGEAVGDVLEMEARVADRKPRRIGAGAELSSLDGVTLSGFWLHRNIAGGAERLRFDAEVRNIGTVTEDIDYLLRARLDVPAAIGPDTHFFTFGEYLLEVEPAYESERFEFGVGLSRIWSEELTTELYVGYLEADTKTDLGEQYFQLVPLHGTLVYDRRDDPLNPKNGYYVSVEATPYLGLGDSDSGARLFGDLRGFKSLGTRNVVAGRLQMGSVLGSEIDNTLPELLFASGGGGTVRGQPYKSLDVDLGGGDRSGGRSFVGLSAELRTSITENIGIVAFADAGYIGAESSYDGNGDWHSGAGLGLRYNTGIGPIRFDVAMPTGGDTGDGVQIYIGIGQAF